MHVYVNDSVLFPQQRQQDNTIHNSYVASGYFMVTYVVYNSYSIYNNKICSCTHVPMILNYNGASSIANNSRYGFI